MAYHIIGLDRGTSTVKAVILEKSFRGYEVKGTRSVPVPQDGSGPPTSEAVRAAVAGLVEEFDPGAVGYVTDYPGQKVSTWFLSLPFTDQKRIDQTLPFELENYVPFDLEDMVLDYRVVRATAGKSRVLAALATRTDVASTLSQLKAMRVDPRSLLLDGDALAHVPPGRPEAGEKPLAVVDIGHTQTLVTVRAGGSADFLRTIPLGGLQVTQALMAAFQVNYRTAELMKHRLEPVVPFPDEPKPVVAGEEGATGPEAAPIETAAPAAGPDPLAVPISHDVPVTTGGGDPLSRRLDFEGGGYTAVETGQDEEPLPLLENDQAMPEGAWGNVPLATTLQEMQPPAMVPGSADEILRVVWDAMAPLLNEIRNALLAYEGAEHLEVGAVLLVGGGALLRGLPEAMEEDLGIPVGLPVRLGPDQVTVGDEAELPRYALPFALAFLGATDGKGGEINFRTGEFSYRKNYQALRGYLLAGIGLAVIGLFVLTGMFISKVRALNAESEGLNTKITQAVKTGFPTLTIDASKGTDRALALMLEEHGKLQDRGRLLGLGVTHRRSIDLLKEISQVIPPREEAKMDVDDFSLEGDTLKMRGVADTFESIDKVEKAIQGSALVKEIKSDVGSKGDKKNFTFTVTLKGPDETTGS